MTVTVPVKIFWLTSHHAGFSLYLRNYLTLTLRYSTRSIRSPPMPKLVSPLDNKEASFFYFWLLNFMKLQTNGAPWKTFRDPLDTASHFNWLHSIPQLVRGFVLLTKHGWSGTGTKKTPAMSANYILEIWIIH